MSAERRFAADSCFTGRGGSTIVVSSPEWRSKMPGSWFGRLLVFVLVLVALRIFFRWNISIVGSLLVTLLVYVVMAMLESRRGSGD